MILDTLKNFSWYNEPTNVRFVESGMQIETKPQTDFWQNVQHNIHKDNGHFFYTEKKGDFFITIKWHFESMIASDQCGLMIRVDSLNWAKTSLLCTDISIPQLGCVISHHGNSDWSNFPLQSMPYDIWFRAVHRGNDFWLYYSVDGINFVQTRMFSLPLSDSSVKIGAYACSPQDHVFECILEDVI